MKEIIDGLVKYTRTAREAGLDGCEIHGSHGYLPQQFRSPRVIRLTHRLARTTAVHHRGLKLIRADTGHDFVISDRVSGSK